ncbi:hypothetical protein Tco_0445655 [Tanacetum coccineum]
MVNTRNIKPRVLDETLRSSILQVVQEANGPVNAALTTLQTNLNTLTDRIQALMMFTFATGELTRLDVTGWLFRVQQFFLIDNVQEDQKIMLVSMHVYDKALEWHKQFLKIHEIKNLKQDGEVKLYQEQFEVLLNMLESIESYAVSLFIRGLKSKISMPVKMFKPTTLKDASCLARMQEATLALTKTKLVSHYTSQRSNSGTYANRYTSHATHVTMTKPLLPLPSTSTENTSKVVKSGFRKQLT